MLLSLLYFKLMQNHIPKILIISIQSLDMGEVPMSKHITTFLFEVVITESKLSNVQLYSHSS